LSDPSSEPVKQPALLNLVLDTNVWLDWLLFIDPDAIRIQQALSAIPHRLIATEQTAGELFEVLKRPALARPEKTFAAMQSQYQQSVTMLDTAPPTQRSVLRCSDPDDQKFIDLALAHPSSVLLSKDKAVLKLGRRLKQQPSTQICHPTKWLA
jgi:uncharacterized protein